MVGERDHDLERELIDDFLQGLPDLVATIRASWEVGDMVVLARAAHTLKSHAVMFGAARLEASCRALEAHASLDSNRTDLSELVAGIEDEVERVGSEVATF
jgi:HPt (histidine-containing phosphotransfer) domain-containing protein